MSAKDRFHQVLKNALEKDKWMITHDPLRLKFGNVNFQIDLGAENIIAAEKDKQKIAIEIKSFLNPSAINDFYSALGQFLSYRIALENFEPERTLYLAIPFDTYKTFFQFEFTQIAINKYQIPLIIYDPISEVIIEWIK